MKTDTKTLIEALNNLKPIIGRRTVLPILSCVKLHTERNRLHITASNLDEFMVERIEVSGKMNPVCVSFFYLLNALSGDETEIKVEKNGMLIKCGDNETEISTLDAGEFPTLPEFKNAKNHGVACDELANAINQVSWAASDDVSSSALNSVLIESTTKKVTVIATNGREMAIRELNLIGSEFGVVIPSEFCANLSTVMARKGASLSTNEAQIKVSHEWGNYYCKQLDAKYPNWRNVIPKDVKPLGSVAVQEFKSLVSSCVPYTENSEAKGIFKFSKKELTVEFAGDNGSKLSRHLLGSFKDFTIALSTRKLVKIFQNIKTDEAKLLYVDELSPLTIEAGDLKVLTMPMRIG